MAPSLSVMIIELITNSAVVLPCSLMKNEKYPSCLKKRMRAGSQEYRSGSPIFPRRTYLHSVAKAKSLARDRSSGTGFREVVTRVIEL
jgi:hypothetical protein